MNFQKFWMDNLRREIESENEEKGKDYGYESGIAHVLKVAGEDREELLIRGLQKCGRCCIEPAIIHMAKKCYAESGENLDAVLEALNEQGLGGGSLRREGNKIYASYNTCYCPNVETQPALPGIYCNCSRGWFSELFERLLDRPVKVEIEQSILRGADACKFVIHL